MKLLFVLLILGLSGMTFGNDCISKKKVNAVIGPILDKRKGLRVTMSPDDLANLVGLKHGCVDSVYLNDSPKKAHFAVYLNNQTVNAKANEAVKFNQVDINQGGAYNPSTGVFVCPKSGTYLLSWFFINASKGSPPAWLRLEINGSQFAFARLNQDEIYNSSFRSNLVVLKKGDHPNKNNG